MCLGGGEGVSSGDQVVQAMYQQQVSALNQDHTKRYKKNVEKAALDFVQDDSTYDAQADQALAHTVGRHALAGEIASREQARSGMVLTPEQQTALDARQNLTRGLDTVHNTNLARSAEHELKQGVRSGMVNLGRQNLQQGMGMYGAMAQAENQRGIYNAQAEEAGRQQLIGGLFQAGGLATGLMMGG